MASSSTLHQLAQLAHVKQSMLSFVAKLSSAVAVTLYGNSVHVPLRRADTTKLRSFLLGSRQTTLES